MNTELSPSPAYHQRHAALLEQRSVVESERVITVVNRALLSGERVSAAFYDLTQLMLLQQRKTLPLLTPAVEQEIADFLQQLKPLIPDRVENEQQFARLQRKVIKQTKRFTWQHASLPLVQSQLFLRTYQRWQQMLEALFSPSSGELAFTRLKQVLKKSSGRMTLLGESHQLFLILQELLTTCREKAAASRQQADELTDYIAAADLATRGIITFALTAEAVLRGHPLPTAAQLARRIRQHQESVIDRTHPWFSAL